LSKYGEILFFPSKYGEFFSFFPIKSPCTIRTGLFFCPHNANIRPKKKLIRKEKDEEKILERRGSVTGACPVRNPFLAACSGRRLHHPRKKGSFFPYQKNSLFVVSRSFSWRMVDGVVLSSFARELRDV
jgi:hypothetical protein